jgi:hypothetical protein
MKASPLRNSITFIVFLLWLDLFPCAAWACAGCGCSLSTDWESQGVSHSSGFSADLRYDYLNQAQLRHGTSTITPAGEFALNNIAEVEDYTKNQYVTLGLGYTSKDNWSVTLLLPYIIRQHDTWGTSPGQGGGGANAENLGGNSYISDFSQIGDAKIMVNFHPVADNHSLGFTMGIKLPTGSTKQNGIQTGITPTALMLVDPGLQPGTGTTDLIAGLFYHQAVSRDWDVFSQAIYQFAVMGPTNSYHPGNGINFNLGARYMSLESVMPQIQLNMRHVNTDSGAIADTLSTGGTLMYLSPGLSAKVTEQASVYGFVQVPLYQNLSGFQLVPRYTLSIGLHYVF